MTGNREQEKSIQPQISQMAADQELEMKFLPVQQESDCWQCRSGIGDEEEAMKICAEKEEFDHYQGGHKYGDIITRLKH